MQYTMNYQSPFGNILLAGDNIGLTGLWFHGEKYDRKSLAPEHLEQSTPILQQTKEWLDIYFSGREPNFMPPLHLIGTPFRMKVWKILREIPYGATITYGEIGERLKKQDGLKKMSAQAVGGAVGHNEISIIVPCHRVVGANGSLTGYAGGIAIKAALLQLEGADMSKLYFPSNNQHEKNIK